MRLFRIFVLVILLGVLPSFGCAYPLPYDVAAPPEETVPASPSAATPPGGTLAFGGETVAGELGGYCWTPTSGEEGELVAGQCVDAVYPLVPGKEKTLVVSPGSQMTFDYGGEETAEAGAELLGPGDRSAESSSEPLEIRGSGGRLGIPADLPVGEHVVSVFVTVPEGDASYYFRVAVRQGAGRLSESGGPGPRGPGDR
jgi:hypothetical protein